ncbi:Acetylspermidine deacetylase [Candidatus Rhodobacter oscarellae]|uniref:Acetylspermidine deacetylase n=1 Tax=Candidatus Rhodobacter oscarellae TaxID=1675527 RepID=A0A0J9EAA2_9RHOB|nr:Acetylspermidine deacetylase [Candidatus Rhodobacter lobularis]
MTPPGHPERVARYQAITQALSDPAFDGLIRKEAPMGDRAEVLRCHPEDYVARIEAAIPAEGYRSLDADTHVSPGSLESAMRAVGGNCAAVDAVLAGKAGNAFTAMRPPGHHAETATAMGFCLFGSVAIAAKRALDHHGLGRVAVIDFDVHHGNGTQDLLWSEGRALFASSHQMPLYPGSGAAHETGAHDNVLNAPLDPMTGSAQMRAAYDQVILPAVRDWQPELILISAGFDAHADDPLANLNWTTEDFAWVTRRICETADAVCDGRVVSTLEGGYDLGALAEGTAAHVQVLMEVAG